MKIYVDIDETICFYEPSSETYADAIGHKDNINKINKLYDEGNHIKYWTARGSITGKDWTDMTAEQLDNWGCQWNELICGKDKGAFDMVIDDKARRIDEI